MLWDKLVDYLMFITFPLVCFYHVITEDVFLNMAVQDATGLEKFADTLLIPYQYVFAGKQVIRVDDEWEFVQRFDYMDLFFPKAVASIIALPSSLIFGAIMKGAAYFFTSYEERYSSIKKSFQHAKTRLNHALYQKLGLGIKERQDLETFSSEGYARRPGDENNLFEGKEALKEIASLLNEEKIVWWVDCGTCLGTYRYGGVIPWDEDIDIAILLPDFGNVFRILRKLDPKKYIAQDWSSREFPKSLIKVYVLHTNTVIDIYHFAIDEKKQQLHYLFSLENNMFFPEWWKIRERRFKAPIAFVDVFPLKKAMFDDIEVFVPQNPKKYLQRCYGEDLTPVKLFNPKTNMYEKDLSHPYWQRSYVH